MLNVKRTVYAVGDIYQNNIDRTCWVLTKILPERTAKYVLSRNGVHMPLTADMLHVVYTLHTEGDGTL